MMNPKGRGCFNIIQGELLKEESLEGREILGEGDRDIHPINPRGGLHPSPPWMLLNVFLLLIVNQLVNQIDRGEQGETGEG